MCNIDGATTVTATEGRKLRMLLMLIRVQWCVVRVCGASKSKAATVCGSSTEVWAGTWLRETHRGVTSTAGGIIGDRCDERFDGRASRKSFHFFHPFKLKTVFPRQLLGKLKRARSEISPLMSRVHPQYVPTLAVDVLNT
jgi:hypothetical protein